MTEKTPRASQSKKNVRHLSKAKGLGETLYRWRFTLARRFVQLFVLLLFVGTFRWGWSIAQAPLLVGDLSSSRLLDWIPLSDPFATLERLFAGQLPTLTVLIGSFLVLGFYALIGSRAFCGWVCPMNFVADTAEWLRQRLGLSGDLVRISRKVRYISLVSALLVSALSGFAAFECISPQAFLWREAVYGIGLGFIAAVAGVFALDLTIMRNGWCGHLCPLGAFWSLAGRFGKVRIRFKDAACTRCSDCLKVCPEPQIIRFTELSKEGRIPRGECLLCGKCIAVCPEKALNFEIPLSTKTQQTEQNSKKGVLR